MSNWVFRENSLDMLRLFAAFQVVVMHTLGYMMPDYGSNAALRILGYFPGVPIFFFISGYLISKAFENSPNNIEYAKNRFLRLYPALIVCVGLNHLDGGDNRLFFSGGSLCCRCWVTIFSQGEFPAVLEPRIHASLW